MPKVTIPDTHQAERLISLAFGALVGLSGLVGLLYIDWQMAACLMLLLWGDNILRRWL